MLFRLFLDPVPGAGGEEATHTGRNLQTAFIKQTGDRLHSFWGLLRLPSAGEGDETVGPEGKTQRGRLHMDGAVLQVRRELPTQEAT